MSSRTPRGLPARPVIELAGPIAALLLVLLPGRPALPAGGGPAITDVTVAAERPLGLLVPANLSNAAYEDAYGPTVAGLAEPAFRWLRAAPAVRYVRCSQWLGDGIPASRSGAFSGCRVYREDPSGSPVFQWEAVDRALDVLVSADVRPVLVLGGMPDALAAAGSKRGARGGMAGRPRDYARYRSLVGALARHLEATYGRDEVRTWYFEVWDQPDRAEYWEGGGLPPGQEEYPADRLEPFFRLYDHFAAGLADADPELRFGGPGTAGDPRFLAAFLRHCAQGPNLATGGRETRLDFISIHSPDPVAELKALRERLGREVPTLAGLPVFLTVPALSSPGQGGFGPEAAAAAVSRAAGLASDPGAHLFQETQVVTDHFSGMGALTARLGRITVPLPLLRAAMLLAGCGGERLSVESVPGVDALAARSRADAVRVLLARPAAGAVDALSPLAVRLRVTGLPRTLVALPLRVYVLDARTQNPYGDWKAAGAPVPAPDTLGAKFLGDELYAPTRSDPVQPVRRGEATVTLDLPAGSVVAVSLGAEGAEAPAAKKGRKKHVLDAEAAYYAGVEAQLHRDYPAAEKRYLDVARKFGDVFWSQTALATLAEMYDLDIRQPDRGVQTRARLLALPVDDTERERLLRQQLLVAVRTGETPRAQSLQAEVEALRKRLAAVTSPPDPR